MRRHQAESYSIMGSLLIIVIMVSIFVYNLSQSERAAQQAMLDAEQSRNIAVNEKELSRQTLERLKLTVPTFIARGRQLLKEHQFVQALEHVDMALEMDAQSEAAWILQGQVLQTMLRIDEAGEAFENALSLRESEAARSGLDLCQWLISNKPKDKELSHEQLRYMHAAYLQQGRFAEAISVLSKMNADAAESYKTWKALLDEIAQKVQFEFTLGVDPDSGLLDLDVSRTQIKDLSMLKGMPLRQLHLPACDINDLSPITNAPLLHLNIDNTKIHRLSSLRDMRLKRLSLRNTPVSSITVLKDMPLTELNISYTQIRDIRSIKQMPLKKLDVSGSKVSNFSYLSGLQLESLILINSPIKDVAVLEGMPLTELWISSMYLRDISPLKTLPLERLSLYGCERLRDVAALKELESLKELIVPRGVDVSVLREHKALQLIGYSHAESYPAAEFWARYDAQQATEE